MPYEKTISFDRSSFEILFHLVTKYNFRVSGNRQNEKSSHEIVNNASLKSISVFKNIVQTHRGLSICIIIQVL
jgi:hypothetical protein